MKDHSRLFDPDQIALIGATDRPGSIGRLLLETLLRGYDAEVDAANPSKITVLGVSCVASNDAVDRATKASHRLEEFGNSNFYDPHRAIDSMEARDRIAV